MKGAQPKRTPDVVGDQGCLHTWELCGVPQTPQACWGDSPDGWVPVTELAVAHFFLKVIDTALKARGQSPRALEPGLGVSRRPPGTGEGKRAGGP